MRRDIGAFPPISVTTLNNGNVPGTQEVHDLDASGRAKRRRLEDFARAILYRRAGWVNFLFLVRSYWPEFQVLPYRGSLFLGDVFCFKRKLRGYFNVGEIKPGRGHMMFALLKNYGRKSKLMARVSYFHRMFVFLKNYGGE